MAFQDGFNFVMQSNKDDDALGPLVSEACEGRISDSFGKQNLHKVQPVQIDLSSGEEEGQNKFKHLEIGKGSGMNGIASRTMGQLLRDFNGCAENVNVSVARLMDSAKANMEEGERTNMMLHKKAEEQNQLIMKYELILQKARHDKQQSEIALDIERQKKQRGDVRYERELDLMKSVLQGHKKSIKEVNASIAKYMIPKGYMAHSYGGGRLVLVSEWEIEQKKKIKDILETFEEQWKSTIKEKSGILGVYNDKIENIKNALKTMKP